LPLKSRMNRVKKKIFLVDDHQLFNDGLKSLLGSEEDIEIIGQSYNARNTLPQLLKLLPDVIFIDINLPDQNGIDLAKDIIKNFGKIKIILLTMYADKQVFKEALKANVHGYLLKNSSKQELLDAIDVVMKGGVYHDHKLRINASDESKDLLEKKFSLTEREIEIIKLVKNGLDSYQIADKVNLSYFTVKTHRRNIHFKLGTTSTPELIKFANDNGF
jgi:DNA-binding NarL/FixJ family response regulator